MTCSRSHQFLENQAGVWRRTGTFHRVSKEPVVPFPPEDPSLSHLFTPIATHTFRIGTIGQSFKCLYVEAWTLSRMRWCSSGSSGGDVSGLMRGPVSVTGITTPHPPTPAPGTHHSASCLYELDSFRDLIGTLQLAQW